MWALSQRPQLAGAGHGSRVAAGLGGPAGTGSGRCELRLARSQAEAARSRLAPAGAWLGRKAWASLSGMDGALLGAAASWLPPAGAGVAGGKPDGLLGAVEQFLA